MPAFIAAPLPTARNTPPRRRRRHPTRAALPSLDNLQKSGTLSLISRRHDYDPSQEATPYVEPEQIALVGVSHINDASNASSDAVTSVIQALRPDAVVVELCRSRAALLYEPDGTWAPAPSMLARALRIGGPAALLMRSLLASFVSSSADGRDVGAEFRAARRAARAVGAELVLGDRPVECTLRRAWRALSLRERALLAFVVVRGALGLGKKVDDIEDAALRETIATGVEAEEGVMDRYVELLRQQFPGVERPLILERDLYLAWSLKRCQAVKGKRCVVGVVGRAHVKGVLKCLREDDELRRRGLTPTLKFRDLVS